MKLAYQTNGWGGVVGHPAGVTSVKDLYYLANGSTEQALEEIGAAGYSGVELFDGNLVQYAGREAELRQLMQRAGVQLVGVYAGANFIYQEILEDELSKIEVGARLAAQFGAEHLVVGGGGVRARGIQDDDYRRLGAGLERVVALARNAGLTPSFHPHLGTMAQSPDQIARVFEHTGINFCPDTAHLYAAGGDPAELIQTYADRIRLVHLKDFKAGQFLPLGQGEMDMDGILAALRAIGYDGWIGVELDGYAGSPSEGARISKAFVEARAG
jgi:inosose dehydratase